MGGRKTSGKGGKARVADTPGPGAADPGAVPAVPADPVPGQAAPDEPAAPSRNEVLLVGRVAAAAQERELPSGDVIVTWRLVVDRGPGLRTPSPGMRASTVDTLDCVAWAPGSRRCALGLAPGDVAQVAGALRRRFWRSGAGAASRCEVEVSQLRRLRRAAAVTPPSPARAPGTAV